LKLYLDFIVVVSSLLNFFRVYENHLGGPTCERS
jgi:FtsH-binding integral membrane protein